MPIPPGERVHLPEQYVFCAVDVPYLAAQTRGRRGWSLPISEGRFYFHPSTYYNIYFGNHQRWANGRSFTEAEYQMPIGWWITAHTTQEDGAPLRFRSNSYDAIRNRPLAWVPPELYISNIPFLPPHAHWPEGRGTTHTFGTHWIERQGDTISVCYWIRKLGPNHPAFTLPVLRFDIHNDTWSGLDQFFSGHLLESLPHWRHMPLLRMIVMLAHQPSNDPLEWSMEHVPSSFTPHSTNTANRDYVISDCRLDGEGDWSIRQHRYLGLEIDDEDDSDYEEEYDPTPQPAPESPTPQPPMYQGYTVSGTIIDDSIPAPEPSPEVTAQANRAWADALRRYNTNTFTTTDSSTAPSPQPPAEPQRLGDNDAFFWEDLTSAANRIQEREQARRTQERARTTPRTTMSRRGSGRNG